MNYQPTENCLKDRIILITGCSQGIGRAVAVHCARYGATVILLSRNINRLTELNDEIMRVGSPQPAIYPFNLATATPGDYKELAEVIKKEFGRLDGLLHNAAQLGDITPLRHYPLRDWFSVMQCNLHAAYLLSQACLPLMTHTSDASIIFTEDNAVQMGQAYWGAYAISKSGLQCLRHMLAQELEYLPNLRINSIDPGPCASPLRAKAFPAQDHNNVIGIEKILPAYSYLLGPDSVSLRNCCLYAQDFIKQAA